MELTPRTGPPASVQDDKYNVRYNVISARSYIGKVMLGGVPKMLIIVSISKLANSSTYI